MTAGEFFTAVDRLPLVSIEDMTGGGGLLIVAPHPDDESLGCGGLIAEACAKRIPSRLVIMSDGAGSHPNSRSYPPAKLRDLREAETLAAALRLGLEASAIRFLRLPDTAIPSHGIAAEGAIDAIIASARECSAGAVCVTWTHDPHCDHVTAAELVGRATPRLRGARILHYPIWGWALPSDAEVGAVPRGLRLDITRHLAAKAAAIAAHRSQTSDLIDDDPDGFRLVPSMLTLFARPFEFFLDSDGMTR